MKKVFAMILALAMVLSMGITAFAAEGTGSITITNATINETYSLYKIFNATFSSADSSAVAYTLGNNTAACQVMFGADGTTENAYFNYNVQTGEVTKKQSANDIDVVNYLTGLVKNGTFGSAVKSETAASSTVAFTDLPYGYYMIVRDTGSAVTIDSNTPNVEVIDKNQLPGTNFGKWINEGGSLVTENTANVGKKVNYQISLEATNYNGAYRIKYYQVYDEYGEGLKPDFTTLKVTVGNTELTKGYFLNQSGDTAYQNGPMGATTDENSAEWYLVYSGNGKFRVTIPWLTKHTLVASNGAHSLAFADDSTSKYDSPSDIVITYSAVVKENATIGGGSNSNLINKANATWTSKNETMGTGVHEVVTKVYGIGLLKDDGTTGKNLAGAEFRIKDADNKAVNVIKTNIEGVYMIDTTDSGTKDNLVVTPVNGKVVILGLAAGKYSLQEVKAPEGYNAMAEAVQLNVGEGTNSFSVFVNTEGKVADIQQEKDGYMEHDYFLTTTVVHNSKGVELPSTGGDGAMMLITFGAILATAFAVLMITQKKMSIYRD